MENVDFNAKIITDNVHGSIGLSKLEQEIINTRTFQRLKKIKHLGLACLVFPAAEHTRFTHSIGVLHVMSLMIIRLKEVKCDKLLGEGGNKNVQKLRLAALLHDVGHYPLSHPGEQVFQWVDYVQSVTDVTYESNGDSNDQLILLNAEKHYKSDAAKHERLGRLILEHANSEIRKILEHHDYDPSEIARIINAEDDDNPFYNQLMSSTLDCDRLDYMLRDAKQTGTYYGNIDLIYILRNLDWDSNERLVCYTPKAITAIEHFITSRYFSYNIIYHKTTLGFELIAKALFYSMIMDKDFKVGDYNGIVHSFTEIKDRIKDDDDFLTNFNDEYFWYYLDLYLNKYEPKSKLAKRLSENLLLRKPLRPIYELKTIETKAEGFHDDKYTYLTKCLTDNIQFKDKLNSLDLGLEHISVAERKIKFEEIEHAVEFDDISGIQPEDRLKLVKIKQGDEIKELITHSGSIVKILSKFKPCIARLYALVDKNSKEEKELKSFVNELIAKKTG